MNGQNSPVAFFITDGKVILYSNKAARQLTGFDEESFVNDCFIGSLEESQKSKWGEIAQSGNGHLELNGVRLQFNVLNFGKNKAYIIDSHGDNPCILKLFIRIFAQQDETEMPSFVLDCDKKVIAANRSFVDFVCDGQSFEGKSCLDFIGCAFDKDNKCPQKSFSALRQPQTARFYSEKKNKYLVCTLNPFTLCDGTVRILGFISNLNLPINILLDEYKREQVKVNAILETQPDLLFIQHKDGTYIDFYASNNSLLFAQGDRIIGRKMSELLPEDVSDGIQKIIEKTLLDGKIHFFEYWLDLAGRKEAFEARVIRHEDDKILSITRRITDLKLAQQKAEEAGSFNQWLLDNIHNVILIQSQDGLEYIHPNIVNLLGYTQGQMQNMPIAQICHPDDVPMVFEYGRQILNDPDYKTNKLNLRFIHKNGNIRNIEAIASKGAFKGKTVGIISLLDVTDSQSLQNKLLESNEFLKSMLGSMRDSVFSVDKNLNYLYVHIPELESRGIDTSWLIGKPLGYNTEDDDPKEVDKIRNAVIKSIKEECSVSFPVRMKMLGKERMYEVVATPFKNSYGESIGSVLVSKDITEQVQAEKQAQTERKRFDLIAGNINDILFEVKDGILTYVSGGVCLTLGRNVEDFVGRPVTNFVNKFILAKIVKLKSNAKFTIVIDDNYGRLRDIEIQHTKIDDTYFGIARDVTDEKSKEEAKRIFLGSVVHELKNPLTIMLGYNDVLLDKFRNDPETSEFLQIMKDSAKREENQINQLLKYNIAKHQYHFVKADANGIFYNIAVRTKMLLQRLSVEKYGEDQVTFNHSLSPTLEGISINVDFQAFSEIFENLAVNAFKYSHRENINISLDACTSEGMIKATIKDKGFGISPEVQRQIFKPFYQFEHESAEKSGFGMGLSTVKLHVESHGGSIVVDSETGKGTTFELNFPISG